MFLKSDSGSDLFVIGGIQRLRKCACRVHTWVVGCP